MRASVVVCTLDRARLLPPLLDRLRAELEGLDGEIVVVDNGSGDDTRAVVDAKAAEAGPPVRYVHEPERGLSRARNRGIRAAAGEVVLFLDDDSLPRAGWARGHLAPYEDERVGAVGGPIELDLDLAGRAPRWWSERFRWFFGDYDLGERPLDYGGETMETPLGGNMSLRRAALDGVGAFAPDLGRIGDELYAAEEFELVHRLMRAGWRAVYNPRAAVVHLVRLDRVRLGYFRERLRWNLATERVLAAKEGFEPPPLRDRLAVALRSTAHDALGLVRGPRLGDRVFFAVRLEHRLRALAQLLLRGRARHAR